HDVTVAGDALFPEAFAQYAPPVVAKPAGVIDDWEFFWAVAARMGLPLRFKYWTYGLSYADIPDGLDLSVSVDEVPDPLDMIRFLCRDSVVPFPDLVANPSGVRPQRPAQYVQPAATDSGARLRLCPPDVA
nr:hypothetical protein [Micromonospora sp. DSM 115978]